MWSPLIVLSFYRFTKWAVSSVRNFQLSRSYEKFSAVAFVRFLRTDAFWKHKNLKGEKKISILSVDKTSIISRLETFSIQFGDRCSCRGAGGGWFVGHCHIGATRGRTAQVYTHCLLENGRNVCTYYASDYFDFFFFFFVFLPRLIIVVTILNRPDDIRVACFFSSFPFPSTSYIHRVNRVMTAAE